MSPTVNEVIVTLKITAVNVDSESDQEEAIASIKEAVVSIFPDSWTVEIVESP